MLRFRDWLSRLIICSVVLVSSALAQSTLTQIRDTVTNPDGSPFNGVVVISWNGSGYPSGSNIAPRNTSVQIYTGALSVLLVPTTTASATSFYVAVYSSSDGTVTWTEDWDVPPSTSALTLSHVRVSSSIGTGSTGSTGTGGSGSGASGGSGSGGSTGSSGSGGSTVTLPISIDDVSDLADDLAAINTTLTTLTASTATLTSTTNSLNTTVSGLSSTSTSLQTSVNGLNSTVAGLNTTVSGLSSSLSTLTGTVTGLTNSQSSTSSTVTGLNTTVNGISTTVNGLNTTVTGLSSSVSGLNATLNGLSSTVSTQGNTLSNLSTTNTSLNSQVSGISTTVTGLTTTVNGLSTTVSSLNSSVASLISTANSSGSGSGSGPIFINADTVAGSLNGTNTVFTLTGTPSPALSLELFRNGLIQTAGVDYTISGSTVTFLAASTPQSTDTLTAFYQVAGTGTALTFSYDEVPTGTVNGTNATFTLANIPHPALSVRLYKNGMLMLQSGDYTLNNSTITFTSTVIPQTGDQLAAYYTH